MNPNQRGVELPAGCKDLYQVLQQPGFKATVSTLRDGRLADIPRCVEEVYRAHYGVSLVLTFSVAEAILRVCNWPDGPKLSIWASKQQAMLKPMFQDCFGFGGEADWESMVTVPLPDLWLEAAQIVETVMRGCGATENSEFGFYFAGPGEW